MQGEINRGRHTDHPAGSHSIRTNQCPPPPSPNIFLLLPLLLLLSGFLINWLSYSRLHHFPPKQSLLSITGSTFLQAAVLAVDQVTAFVMKGRKLICIALIMSHASLSAQVWHVLTRDHTVLPATHTCIHKWNEPYMSLIHI